MFAALLTLLPALRVPTLFAVLNAGGGRSAVDSCVEAVQIYFPCKSPIQTTNHTCLCEQYLWRLSCLNEHATSTSPHSDRKTTEADATRYCRAAGSFGANSVQRKQRLHGRQIGSVISSIAAEVTSILASNDVKVPTAVVTSAINGVIQTLEPSASNADVTAIASSIETVASSAATLLPTHSISGTQTPTITSVDPIVTSSGNFKPSIGLIVGAVFGGVGVLTLLGILIMLIFRHKKRKAAPHIPTDKEATPKPSFSNPYCSSALVDGSPHIPDLTAPSFPGSTLATSAVPGAGAAGHNPYTFAPHIVHQQPQNQHHNPHTKEKVAFHMQPQHPREHEMVTTANVWEIDGREMQHPQELESPNAEHTYQPSAWQKRVGGGEGHRGYSRATSGDLGRQGQERVARSREDEYFASPISPVSPIHPWRF